MGSLEQEKALDLEDKLHKKEKESDGHVHQLSKISQGREDLAMPRAEAVEDLKIEVGDSITTIQHLVETHELRDREVSGSILLSSVVRALAAEFPIQRKSDWLTIREAMLLSSFASIPCFI